MTILNSKEIFELHVLEHIDKFTLVLLENIPSFSTLSEQETERVFKLYFDHECDFSFYFWLETISLLKKKNKLNLAMDVAEHVITALNQSNYGLLIAGEERIYYYLSLEGYGELYEFNTMDEFHSTKKSRKEVFTTYIA